jgi:hypothetical protein
VWLAVYKVRYEESLQMEKAEAISNGIKPDENNLLSIPPLPN